jgi:hypothetical protein
VLRSAADDRLQHAVAVAGRQDSTCAGEQTCATDDPPPEADDVEVDEHDQQETGQKSGRTESESELSTVTVKIACHGDQYTWRRLKRPEPGHQPAMERSTGASDSASAASLSFCRPRYFQLLTVDTGTPMHWAASW